MKLWPTNATTTWASTTRVNAIGKLKAPLLSTSSAKVPLTLLTMNQPIPAVSVFRPAGRITPR